MILKTKTKKVFTLTLSKDELTAIELAIALMLDNEHTHKDWINKLEPISGPMREALNLDPDYRI